MMLNNKNFNHIEPIGIFDSGIGGLNVAKAIKYLLPHKALCYIGDNAHCPWGEKSSSQINLYSNKLTNFLVKENCKTIVVACNTASCISNESLTKNFKNIKIFNVIAPTLAYLANLDLSKYKNIGIIGTKQTIASQHYQVRLENLQNKLGLKPKLEIKAKATPLLVSLIEEGLTQNLATNLIIEQYLKDLDLGDNSILILGCTHYALINRHIQTYYANLSQKVTIIDPTQLIAAHIKEFLSQSNQAHGLEENLHPESDKFFCTEDSKFFKEVARYFFPNIELQFLPIW